MDSNKGTLEVLTERNEPASQALPRKRPLVSKRTLERVKARNSQALATFFEFYFERVYGFAFRLLGEKAAAEDVTQDVFYKVHRAAHQLDADRDPGPWLMTITHNVCRDYWRSRGHKMAQRSQSLEGTEGLMSILPSREPDPETRSIQNERNAIVQQAILRLPEPLRAIVILKDYRGLTHEEIAETTGASYDAVRKRYSRALAKLAQDLKDVLR